MGIIHVLPEVVANKIAAGEVIERPASIVKELVENSLDAQATAIEISIHHGGKSLIRVADNGCGMSAPDAELAFQRHATSKIMQAEDLDCIASFGFRGEALPSIAAVSRTKLVTRLKGETSGTEVDIEGGKTLAVKPCPSGEGTIVEVRDLFFNTPARRKFVKADSTELGHIMDAVSNLAFANPSIRFLLKSAEKTLLDVTPAQSIFERVTAVWSGEEVKYLIPIEGEGKDIRIHGVIGKPQIAHSNRAGQVYFVNKRWVRSTGFGYAVQDGYHGLLMQGQYPVAVVFIEVNPERVDVNVHPTKQEVRISKEAEIKSLIRRTVTEALQKESDLAPQLKMASRTPVEDSSRISLGPVQHSYLDFQEKLLLQSGNLKVAEPEAVKSTEPAESNLVGPISFRGKMEITKILGQIHNTFIIAETSEGMIVIDQHAAHERVMFEILVKEFESGSPKRQGLLMDAVLELHPRQCEIMKRARPVLEKSGFEIEEFGENTFVVRAYPAILEGEDPVAVLKRFVEEIEEGKLRTRLDDAKEEIAALVACKKKSVKAHDPMSLLAMRLLLERLSRCENPFNCPHGRPTFFKHTFNDLEQQFKRK